MSESSFDSEDEVNLDVCINVLNCGHTCAFLLRYHPPNECPECSQTAFLTLQDGTTISRYCNGAVGNLDLVAFIPEIIRQLRPRLSRPRPPPDEENGLDNISVSTWDTSLCGSDMDIKCNRTESRFILYINTVSPYTMVKCLGFLPCGHQCQSYCPIIHQSFYDSDQCRDWRICNHFICELCGPKDDGKNYGVNSIYREKLASELTLTQKFDEKYFGWKSNGKHVFEK